jgi:hypothetical protein
LARKKNSHDVDVLVDLFRKLTALLPRLGCALLLTAASRGGLGLKMHKAAVLGLGAAGGATLGMNAFIAQVGLDGDLSLGGAVLGGVAGRAVLGRMLTRRKLAILGALAGSASSAWWDASHRELCERLVDLNTSQQVMQEASNLKAQIDTAISNINEEDLSQVETNALETWKKSWRKSAEALQENLDELWSKAPGASMESARAG